MHIYFEGWYAWNVVPCQLREWSKQKEYYVNYLYDEVKPKTKFLAAMTLIQRSILRSQKSEFFLPL